MTLDRVRTTWRLGPANVARVGAYRLLLRAGLHPVQRLPEVPLPAGPFFPAPPAARPLAAPSEWSRAGCWFGWFRAPLADAPPDWHRNPIDGGRAADPSRPWWRIPDFDPALGDVKTVWEASRLDWAVNLAQQAAAGRAGALARLEAWLADWCRSNPTGRGHNWKCAQEASIRVLHLAVASQVLGGLGAPSPALVALVEVHLARIEPTLAYAEGQQNNHGTSEAAALLVGGAWLASAGVGRGARWAGLGRRQLERLVPRLVGRDGSFSQYSLNYHRLMLDSLSLAEAFRRRLGQEPFSDRLLGRATAATRWLRAMVDPASGDAPNYGANDGANLLPLTAAGYRDFRPAVALATALFEGHRAYEGPGPWDDHLAWLEVAPGEGAPPAEGTQVFDDGGQAILRAGRDRVVVIFPRYRFRPVHCDALHVDLWVGAEALLRDGGTYGYAGEERWQDYFSGAAGHNGVQIDGRDQMPRLGRFLRGSWLPDAEVEGPGRDGDAVTFTAGYVDGQGSEHRRALRLAPGRLEVRDAVTGVHRSALLRWRLRPGPWRLDGEGVTDGVHRLEVHADRPVVRRALVEGWESLHYLQRTPLPVLEVEVDGPVTFTTTCRWPA